MPELQIRLHFEANKVDFRPFRNKVFARGKPRSRFSSMLELEYILNIMLDLE